MKAKTAFILLVAGFGGTLFDFGGTIIAPAIPYLESLGRFTAAEISSLTSAVVASAGVACFLAGFLADRFGRKPVMLAAGALAALAAVPICCSGGSFRWFWAGRFIQGFAAGTVGVVVPMYLVEVLPANTRGKGAAVFQLLDIGGIFFCSLVGMSVVRFVCAADAPDVAPALKETAWHLIFWSGSLPALAFFAGALFLKESPAMESIRKGGAVPASVSSDERQFPLTSRRYTVPFVLAVVTLICNQTTAVTSLQYYAVKLYQEAGFSNTAANTANGITTAIFVLTTAFALPLVDRKGRRPLMIGGTAGVLLAHVFTGLVFLALQQGWIAKGPVGAALVTCGITGVIAAFGIGPGVVAWLVLSELMPTRIRARGMSIAMFFNMLVAYLIADRMIIVGERFGYSWMFFFFAACTLGYVLLAVFALPETRGRTLDEIERLFE